MFFWAKSATLLNRPLPPLPNLELSDAHIEKIANISASKINRVLSVARDITVNGDLKLFIKIASGLLLVSFVGSLFNFFTLVYIGVVLALVVPVVYEKYQDKVDEKLGVAQGMMRVYSKKFDDILVIKVGGPPVKEKKTE